jgi:hypothetical protein
MRWCLVPDLADELRRVADEAARDARPMPAAAVMTLGDRRRRRRWSRNILAAALAAGTVAVIAVVAGTSAPATPEGPKPAAAPGGCTERVTLAAADGRMSGCVSYQYLRHGLYVRSVVVAFTAAAGFAMPQFTFTFRNQFTGTVDYQFSTPPVEGNAILSHSTGPILLGARPQMRAVHQADILQITLKYEAPDGRIDAVATLSLSLNPHGLLCPNLGQESFGSSNGGRGVPSC